MLLVALVAAAPVRIVRAVEAEAVASAEKRLADSTRYLSDDALEGRGVGTAGIDKAADYLAEQFAALGLNTKLYDGTPFQKFKMPIGSEMGEPNVLSFAAPAASKDKSIELKLSADFTPLAMGSSSVLDVPLVFAGYGVTAKDKDYDDYAGLDVEGKAVVILRRLPQEGTAHPALGNSEHSLYAPMSRKVSNAYEHGAAAVILVSSEAGIEKNIEPRRPQLKAAVAAVTEAQAEFQKIEKPTLAQAAAHQKRLSDLIEDLQTQNKNLGDVLDPLLPFNAPGGGDPSHIPVVHCQRAVVDRLLKEALGTSLNQLEHEIDKGPTPHSRELTGWRLTGEINVIRREAEVKNVVAVLEGEGPKADETIVVGAHYDHLGFGGEGSFVNDGKQIHNGADDNGSGTAALLEVARILATREKKLPRRVVFIAFTGEERGLIGSARYCKEPLFPLENTVAMLNMDMVGRLKDEKLIIQGINTAPEFGPIIDRLNQAFGFDLTRKEGGSGPSDHSSFYAKKIPVMHYFTGLHSDYHRPSDDFDKINVPGMRRVAEIVAATAAALAESDARPTYVETKSSERAGGDGDRPYFGSIPDFGQEEPGYAISGATKDSPADKAGLKGGDIIVKLGDSKIGNLEDFDNALRKFKGGDKVPVVVKRGSEEVRTEVTLAPPR
ncbi:MAG TPA: M20/M25/M40 family metallo-hydrolase [Pirellulales bacterium]|nr:M20/M25/M40 family metallo-hydrolase [Pirellulales bacterium]